MRTLTRLFALVLVTGVASSAFARELDDRYANTSITPAPVRSTTSSQQQVDRHGKKDVNVPAKYDAIYPVRDHAQKVRERGAI